MGADSTTLLEFFVCSTLLFAGTKIALISSMAYLASVVEEI